MIPSIRRFLLINLLLSITLIISFAIISNLFLEHKEIQNYLDEQLVIKTMSVQAFIKGYLQNSAGLSELQKRLDKVPDETANTLQKEFPDYEQVQFSIWDNQTGKLILKSDGAPLIDYRFFKPGFSDQWIQNESWRFFSFQDVHNNLTLIVSEKHQLRDALETHITRDSIFIMLVSYPFLGLLIWIIVGQGFTSLKEITNEVRSRELLYLEPVNIEEVPTEIKPLIDELNELFQRLNDAYAREKRFAADAAHELRTPLAALRAQAQVALKSSSEKERDEALSKVLAGVDRSTHVVEQLLTLSRTTLEAKRGEEAEPIDLRKHATFIIADLVPQALDKETEIELDAPPQLALIMGFPTAIDILLRNLIDNAIRYTPSGSLIRLVISETAENVILQVIDNGPGIPENLRKRVFERFFRILGNKTTGSGLGLGIVQQIVELHHAEINLGSPPNGQGLQVTIKFPKS